MWNSVYSQYYFKPSSVQEEMKCWSVRQLIILSRSTRKRRLDERYTVLWFDCSMFPTDEFRILSSIQSLWRCRLTKINVKAWFFQTGSADWNVFCFSIRKGGSWKSPMVTINWILWPHQCYWKMAGNNRPNRCLHGSSNVTINTAHVND